LGGTQILTLTLTLTLTLNLTLALTLTLTLILTKVSEYWEEALPRKYKEGGVEAQALAAKPNP